jgi:tRNA modification GTPase
MHDLSTTLVAVATAPGRGGLGCVRLSGDRAWPIARSLFRARGAARVPQLGTLLDEDGRRIDHGFLVEFEAGRSFTGEPAAELWTHGSPPVLAAVVEAAVAAGATPASAGEFTYRALRHGRIDLPRAEAIRDLIHARTKAQARAAFAQVEGAAARRMGPLRERLVDAVARAEAAVEFVDEDDVDASGGVLGRAAPDVLALARELLDEARRGRVFREGARVAICGAPSVGKSSLFNHFLGSDRAIVSPVPGTTRDTLEETIDLDGIPVTLVDTAGLRPVEDPIEAEGVRRARAAAAEADVSILVLDATREETAEERQALDGPCLVVVNKIDLVSPPFRAGDASAIPISTVTGAGCDRLRAALRGRCAPDGAETPALTHVRHALALERVVAALERASTAASSGLSDEAVLLDFRDALDALGELTGEIATEELYDRIFATFCIGK